MRILLIHNRYVHEGGEEESVAALAALLTSHGHEVQRWERSSREWLDHSFKERMFDAFRVIHSPGSATALRKAIEDFKPDLVHAHNIFPVFSPSVLSAAHRTGTAVVQTLHNYRWLCANGLFLTPEGDVCERCKGGNFFSAVRFGCYQESRLRSIPMAASLMFHRACRTPERSVDRFIAPSRFLRDQYVQAGWSEERIDVIPNPIRLPALRDTPRSSGPLFVYAGRLSREKGIMTLLKVFKENTPGRLVLLGDGPLLKLCRESASDRIEVAGRVPHEIVFEKLASAWALIMPSECYENLPQAVLESWVSGTPVLAARLGGLAELIQEGETGWTFKPGDAGDLARQLRQITAHPEMVHNLSDRCRARAQKFYNGDDIYSKIIYAYHCAIKRRTEFS